MNKLKKFKHYNEAIFAGEVGPNYGKQILRNTLSTKDTDLIQSDITGEIYSYDQYQELYNNYLKSGGKILDGFTKENIDKILSEINESVEDINKRNWREKFEEIKDYFLEFQDDGIISSYNIGFGTKSGGVWEHHNRIRVNKGQFIDDTKNISDMNLYCNDKKYVFSLNIEFQIPIIYRGQADTCLNSKGGKLLSDILQQCSRISQNDWIIYIDIDRTSHSYKPIKISFIENDDTLKRI